MSRFSNPIPQYILANGDLASAGTLTFYATNTDVLIPIYSDEAETITITNPVTLGDRGEVPNVFFSVAARAVLRDNSGTIIYDVDPVINSGGGSGGVGGWNATTNYSQLSIVYASDSEFYVSLVNDNVGNDPTADTDNSANWTRFDLLKFWNDQETYIGGDLVIRGGAIYVSQVSDNIGNDPANDLVGNWFRINDALLSPYNNTTSGLAANNVKSALDEIVNNISSLNTATTYRGQLDVSSGDAALPSSPSNGDFYIISTGGTITVSSNGGAPTPTPVTAGQAIVYNLADTQWDLITGTENAVNINYNNVTSGLTATNVQAAVDEVDAQVDLNTTAIVGLNNTLAGLGAGSTYRGQLDVSTGDSALPLSPAGGDLYFISVGGTITVSVAGASPTPTAVDAGDSIIYNDNLVQWDLLVDNSSAIVDQAADYNWTGTHTFAIGLLPASLDLSANYNFTGQLQVNGNDVFTSANINEALISLNTQTGTSYTAVLADRNGIIEMNNAGANTLTIPLNSSVAYPVGTTISVVQLGAGQTTITGDGGVTINSASGFNILAQYGRATLYKRATDVWVMNGDLTA